MPWIEIPPENLAHLGLFGYDFIREGADGFVWYHGPLGRTAVDPSKPIVWVEDISEALQLGAKGIAISDNDD